MHRRHRPLDVVAEAAAEQSMQRYFYDIRRGTEIIRDPDGELQPDLAAALAEARAVARDLIVDALRTAREIDDDHVLIRDGGGMVVGSIPLVDALPIRERAQQGPKGD